MLKTGKFIIISTGTSNGRMLGFNKRKAEQANIVNGMWWVRWGSLKKKKKGQAPHCPIIVHLLV